SDQVDKLGDAFMQMESRDKLYGFLGLSLSLFSGYAIDNYLGAKVELRKLDIAAIEHEAERNERLDTLNLMQRQGEEETKRLQIALGAVSDRYPEVKSMQGYVAGAYDKIISGVADAES